jgi:hypothetical protein
MLTTSILPDPSDGKVQVSDANVSTSPVKGQVSERNVSQSLNGHGLQDVDRLSKQLRRSVRQLTNGKPRQLDPFGKALANVARIGSAARLVARMLEANDFGPPELVRLAVAVEQSWESFYQLADRLDRRR